MSIINTVVFKDIEASEGSQILTISHRPDQLVPQIGWRWWMDGKWYRVMGIDGSFHKQDEVEVWLKREE